MDRTVTRVVHVKHLAGYILKKWRILLLGVLVGVCAFSVVGVVTIKKSQQQSQVAVEKKKKISVTEAEFANVQGIIDYEILLAEKEAYLENSILMQIDPLSKWSCNDVYTVTFHPLREQTEINSDDKVKKNSNATTNSETGNVPEMVNTVVGWFSEQSFWENLSNKTEDKLDVGYLREIAGVALVAGDKYRVTVHHVNQEKARELGDLIEQCLQEMIKENSDFEGYVFENEKGDPAESVDNGLIELQKNTQVQMIGLRDTLANRRYALTDGAREYLELYREAQNREDYIVGQPLEKMVVETKTALTFSFNTMTPFMIRGSGIGVIISFILVIVMYCYHPCILNPKNAKELYGLRILNDKQECLTCDSEYELIVAKIGVNISEQKQVDKKVLLTGSIRDERSKEGMQKLKKQLEELGIHSVESSFLKEKTEEIKKLKEVKHVILVEQLGKTRFDDLSWEVSLCEESHKEIIGVVFV